MLDLHFEKSLENPCGYSKNMFSIYNVECIFLNEHDFHIRD